MTTLTYYLQKCAQVFSIVVTISFFPISTLQLTKAFDDGATSYGDSISFYCSANYDAISFSSITPKASF